MISFFNQDIDFVLRAKVFNRSWLRKVIHSEGKRAGDINIIFCSDPVILDTNIKYLGHSYYTDIITFDYCHSDIVSGDLFIGVAEVLRNADDFSVTFDEEISRVMVHGILHLIGYDDHTHSDITMMRAKENEYLALRNEMMGNHPSK